MEERLHLLSPAREVRLRSQVLVEPAENGLIAYSYAGDIYVGDPATGETTAIVTNPSYEVNPVFSPDGTRIAFIRGNFPIETPSVVVVRPNGSDERVVMPEQRHIRLDTRRRLACRRTRQPGWPPSPMGTPLAGGRRWALRTPTIRATIAELPGRGAFQPERPGRTDDSAPSRRPHPRPPGIRHRSVRRRLSGERRAARPPSPQTIRALLRRADHLVAGWSA